MTKHYDLKYHLVWRGGREEYEEHFETFGQFEAFLKLIKFHDFILRYDGEYLVSDNEYANRLLFYEY